MKASSLRVQSCLTYLLSDIGCRSACFPSWTTSPGCKTTVDAAGAAAHDPSAGAGDWAQKAVAPGRPNIHADITTCRSPRYRAAKPPPRLTRTTDCFSSPNDARADWSTNNGCSGGTVCPLNGPYILIGTIVFTTITLLLAQTCARGTTPPTATSTRGSGSPLPPPATATGTVLGTGHTDATPQAVGIPALYGPCPRDSA
jgi:hypothetical protein